MYAAPQLKLRPQCAGSPSGNLFVTRHINRAEISVANTEQVLLIGQHFDTGNSLLDRNASEHRRRVDIND
jgi:hypothetical protein